MMLVEAGKIHLEDPIAKYFPEAPEAWRDITIRHLLSHTSGIQNHVAIPHWLDVFKIDLAFETSPARDELLIDVFQIASGVSARRNLGIR
jgi:CubicO group peptidase (beta-lactamase class C family)